MVSDMAPGGSLREAGEQRERRPRESKEKKGGSLREGDAQEGREERYGEGDASRERSEPLQSPCESPRGDVPTVGVRGRSDGSGAAILSHVARERRLLARR
ncbi:unnamed protein product [Lampetra fluviatilis]